MNWKRIIARSIVLGHIGAFCAVFGMAVLHWVSHFELESMILFVGFVAWVLSVAWAIIHYDD